MNRFIAIFLVMTACSGKTTESAPDTDENEGSGCGEVSSFDVTIVAKVTAGGRPASGYRVFLDDRGWNYTSLGEGTTDASGEVSFVATGVTSVENCWGTVLNYWVVAEDADGNQVEDDMNNELFNAIDDGSLVADVTSRPLEF